MKWSKLFLNNKYRRYFKEREIAGDLKFSNFTFYSLSFMKSSFMVKNRSHNYDDDDDNDSHDRKTSSWCRENCCRLFFVFILIILSIGTTATLIIVLYTDAMKEKALAERRKDWMKKWDIIKPFVQKFPLGFLLGFIRNLIVVAIERQTF